MIYIITYVKITHSSGKVLAEVSLLTHINFINCWKEEENNIN